MANKMIENNFAYKVKEQPEWFYKTLRKAKTIDGGYIRVLSNVTKDTNVRKLVMDKNTISQLDGRDCSWTPTKRFTFDSKLMSVRNYKINEEQCLQDLDSLYSEMIFNAHSESSFFRVSGLFVGAVTYRTEYFCIFRRQ